MAKTDSSGHAQSTLDSATCSTVGPIQLLCRPHAVAVTPSGIFDVCGCADVENIRLPFTETDGLVAFGNLYSCIVGVGHWTDHAVHSPRGGRILILRSKRQI